MCGIARRIYTRSVRLENHHVRSDELLERPIDGRSHLGVLPEVDGGNSALANAFGCELEFLLVRQHHSFPSGTDAPWLLTL